eukprot:g1873.t1
MEISPTNVQIQTLNESSSSSHASSPSLPTRLSVCSVREAGSSTPVKGERHSLQSPVWSPTPSRTMFLKKTQNRNEKNDTLSHIFMPVVSRAIVLPSGQKNLVYPKNTSAGEPYHCPSACTDHQKDALEPVMFDSSKDAPVLLQKTSKRKQPLWKIARVYFGAYMREILRARQMQRKRRAPATRVSRSRVGRYASICMQDGSMQMADALAIGEVMASLVNRVSKFTRRKRREQLLRRAARYTSAHEEGFEAEEEEDDRSIRVQCCNAAMWCVDMVARYGDIDTERKRKAMQKRIARRFNVSESDDATLVERVKIDHFNHLPAMGWHCEVVRRQTGKTQNRLDVYYFAPTGHKLRSRPDVFAYLELVPRFKVALSSKDGTKMEDLRPTDFSFCGETMAPLTGVRLAALWRDHRDDDEEEEVEEEEEEEEQQQQQESAKVQVLFDDGKWYDGRIIQEEEEEEAEGVLPMDLFPEININGHDVLSEQMRARMRMMAKFDQLSKDVDQKVSEVSQISVAGWRSDRCLVEALHAGVDAGLNLEEIQNYVIEFYTSCVEAEKQRLKEMDEEIQVLRRNASRSSRDEEHKLEIVRAQEACAERHREIVLMRHVIENDPAKRVPAVVTERVDTSIWLLQEQADQVRGCLRDTREETSFDLSSDDAETLEESVRTSSYDVERTYSRLQNLQVKLFDQTAMVFSKIGDRTAGNGQQQSDQNMDDLLSCGCKAGALGVLQARLSELLTRQGELEEKLEMENGRNDTIRQRFLDIAHCVRSSGGSALVGAKRPETIDQELGRVSMTCESASSAVPDGFQIGIEAFRQLVAKQYASSLADIERARVKTMIERERTFQASLRRVVETEHDEFMRTCEVALRKVSDSRATRADLAKDLRENLRRIVDDLKLIEDDRRKIGLRRDAEDKNASRLEEIRMRLRKLWMEGKCDSERYATFMRRVLEVAPASERMVIAMRAHRVDLQALANVRRTLGTHLVPLDVATERLIVLRRFLDSPKLMFEGKTSEAVVGVGSISDVNAEPSALRRQLVTFRNVLLRRLRALESDILKRSTQVREACEAFDAIKSHFVGHRELLHEGKPVKKALAHAVELVSREKGDQRVKKWYDVALGMFPSDDTEALKFAVMLVQYLKSLLDYRKDPSLIRTDRSEMLGISSVSESASALEQRKQLVKVSIQLAMAWTRAAKSLDETASKLRIALDSWREWRDLSGATAELHFEGNEVRNVVREASKLLGRPRGLDLWPEWFLRAADVLPEFPLPPAPKQRIGHARDPESGELLPVPLLKLRHARVRYSVGDVARIKTAYDRRRRRRGVSSKSRVADTIVGEIVERRDPAAQRMAQIDIDRREARAQLLKEATGGDSMGPREMLQHLTRVADVWETMPVAEDRPHRYFVNRHRKLTSWFPPGTTWSSEVNFGVDGNRGTSEVVITGLSEHLCEHHTFSLSFKIKTASGGTVLSFGPPGVGASRRQHMFNLTVARSNGVICFNVLGCGVSFVGFTQIANNLWHEVSLVVDRERGDVALFVDGVLDRRCHFEGLRSSEGGLYEFSVPKHWVLRLGAAHDIGLARETFGGVSGAEKVPISKFFVGSIKDPTILLRSLTAIEERAVVPHPLLSTTDTIVFENGLNVATSSTVDSDVATSFGRDFAVCVRLRTLVGGTIVSKIACSAEDGNIARNASKWRKNAKALFVVSDARAKGSVAYCVGKRGLIYTDRRVDDGKWHHVAVTYRLESGLVQIWIDGEVDAEATIDASADELWWTTRVGLGASNFPTPRSAFDGEIASLYYWNGVPTTFQEILEIVPLVSLNDDDSDDDNDVSVPLKKGERRRSDASIDIPFSRIRRPKRRQVSEFDMMMGRALERGEKL